MSATASVCVTSKPPWPIVEMRQVVRKIEPSRGTPFEDRLWPVATALLILGGGVLCVILATLQYDDPRLGLSGAFLEPVDRRDHAAGDHRRGPLSHPVGCGGACCYRWP